MTQRGVHANRILRPARSELPRRPVAPHEIIPPSEVHASQEIVFPQAAHRLPRLVAATRVDAGSATVARLDRDTASNKDELQEKREQRSTALDHALMLATLGARGG